jgi:outer membrane murein-binding lipoprotein Lpp
VVRERVAVPAVDVALERAVDSLRTWLLIVGVLALAAIGVAIYAVVRADQPGGSRRGLATDARVDKISNELKALKAGAGASSPAAATSSTTALSARVDQLSSQIQSLRTGGTPAALGGRVATLESTVKTLAARPAGSDPTQALSQLSSRVDTLASDVAQLKQSQTTTP